MNTKDLGRDNRRDRKAVEHVYKRLPYLDAAPPFAFVIEAIYSSDVGTFMISTKEEKVFGEFDFVTEEKENGLQTLLASINIISQEEIVGLRWEPAHLKEAD